MAPLTGTDDDRLVISQLRFAGRSDAKSASSIGWSARNSIVLLFTYLSGGGVGARRVAASYHGGRPSLHVTWSQSAALAVYKYKVSYNLANTLNSGEECKTDGSVRLSSSDLELSHDPSFKGCEQLVALRYEGVGMAQAAALKAATLTFAVKEVAGKGKITAPRCDISTAQWPGIEPTSQPPSPTLYQLNYSDPLFVFVSRKQHDVRF